MEVVSGMLRALRARRLAREQYSFELLKSSSAHDFRAESVAETRLGPASASAHERLSYGATAARTPSPRARRLRRCATEAPSARQKSEEVIDYTGCSSAMSDVSVMLGFIHAEPPFAPSCSGFPFSSEDSTYEKAVSECHAIKESPLFTEGLLLKCIDHKPLFPYLHFAHFASPDYTRRTGEVTQVIRDCGAAPNSQYGCYDEVFTIQKAASTVENRLPAHRHAGYIVIGFKLLDDASKVLRTARTRRFQPAALEKTWLQWSGAREIYKYSPRNWNLRRISLLRHPNVYRNGQPRPFAYVLLCEYGSILHPSNTVQALDMCERMRVRNCGHVALYQVHTAYNSSPTTSALTSSPSSHRVIKRNPMMRGFSQDVESTESRRQRLRPARDRSFGGFMEEENFDAFGTPVPAFDAFGSPSFSSSPLRRSPQTFLD